MASQSGIFTVSWNVTPSASNIDGVLGLSRGAADIWTDLAAIVLFDVSGRVLVRNGSTYQAATAFTYSGGVTYAVRMVVDLAAKRYSVFIHAPGAVEQQLANGYAFRTEQAAVSALDSWALHQDEPAGTLTACDFYLR
jgi:hypothetical protein